MSLERREVIWVAVIVAVLTVVFLAAYMISAQGQHTLQAALPSEPRSKWDARMLELDKEALDAAYRTQIEHLFAIWMRAGDEKAPERAVVGAKNARRAYIKVMDAIEQRERARQ